MIEKNLQFFRSFLLGGLNFRSVARSRGVSNEIGIRWVARFDECLIFFFPVNIEIQKSFESHKGHEDFIHFMREQKNKIKER